MKPALPAWKPLAEAYHAHHFACPTCIAAGQGYGARCPVGLPLWNAYNAPEKANEKKSQ